MVRRRATFNPLEQPAARHWLVVRSMHGSLIESRDVELGADLKRVFVEAILEWMNAGWRIGDFSSTTGAFFCDRGPERRMVGIVPTDPDETPSRMYGACPTCD